MLAPPRAMVVAEELDSTNAEAFRRIQAGDDGPGVLLALSQTNGRGRRGRRWESPKGGLFFTYYGAVEAPVKALSLLGFAASLAVADLAEDFGADAVRLKWPNDVLLNGAKLSGILLESMGKPGGGAWLVLGVGVNLASAPDRLDQPAAGLGLALTPEAAAERLTARLLHWSGRLQNEGFAPLRQAWLAKSYGLGEWVRTAGAEPVEGAFIGLDADGALLLDTSRGCVRITAGEVFFPGRFET